MTGRIGWKRLLVLGRDCEEIATRIRAARPDLVVTSRDFATATSDDLRAAEMLLAFRVPPGLASDGAHLSWIQSTGAGVDGLLSSLAIAPSTLLTRVLDVFGAPMSEYVLLRCLAIAQDLDRQRRAQERSEWDVYFPRLLCELEIAVLGVGEIGATIAKRLSDNGAQVIGINRRGTPVPGVARIAAVSRLHEVLPRVDVLVIVVPRTTETNALIGAQQLAAMKPGAWLVNVARGSCVDEPALIAALREGRLGGAALDVFEHEPLPRESPLWALPNVWVSPHVSGLTRPEQAADAFLDNLRRIEAGEAARGIVDPSRGY